MGLARLLIAWLLACLVGSAAAVELSVDELAWARAHGPVRVVLVPTAEPYYESGRDGRSPSGFAIEMLERLAQRAGLELQYVTASNVPDALLMLRERRADLTPVMRLSRERARYLSVPGTLLPMDMVVVSRRENTQADLRGDLRGRRLAVLAGSVNDEQFSGDFPDAFIERYPTLRDALRAVADGRADFAPTTLQEAVYLIESQLLGNLMVRRLPGAARADIGPGVRLDLVHLHSMLAKAFETITPAERAEVARRWLPVGAATAFAAQAAGLTPAERAWAERHGEIRAGFDARFAPFTLAGALGGMDGLGADMLRAAADRAGLRVVAQRGGSFADIYRRALASDEVNVVVGMARTVQRSAEFLFVGPFSSVPTAMVMRNDDSRRFSEPDDMASGSVGLLREHFLMPRLRLRNPGLRLVEFDSQFEVLQALADGQVDAAIGNSVVVSRLVEAQFAGRLGVTGVVSDGESELYYGVPRRHPELARVLDRGLAALTPDEVAALNRRWLFVQVQPGLHWGEVLRWVGPVAVSLLLLLGVMWLAYRRLQAAQAASRRAHAAALEATAARGRFLAYLAHEVRGFVFGISSGASLLRQADPGVSRESLVDAIESSAERLRNLLETTLASERAMTQGVSLSPQTLSLADWWQRALQPQALAAQRRGLHFESAPPQADVRLSFDGDRLAQVLANLVGNAIKFCATRVRVQGHWDDARGWLRVEVEDDGPGIPAVERPSLFEPYAQGELGRRTAHGAGLGLAIARDIVSAMGGRIVLSPEPEPGSRFTLELPLQRVPQGAAA